LVDDAFQLHENLGIVVANQFGYQPMAGLRAQDFGELTVTASAALILLPLLAAAYYWGSRAFKRACRPMVVLLGLLVIVGVGVDMIHIIVQTVTERSVWHRLLIIVEDGGEMLVMSLICAYALHLLLQTRISTLSTET
jgi:hypothetical protein